jgi:N utilization substance protein B
MALSQQKLREIVLQLLYSQDIIPSDESLMLQLMSSELEISKKNVRLALVRFQQIQENLSEIDESIRSVSTSYDFNRIHKVTKSILRLAVFELFFDSSIPPKVAIAEAIRLSRKFSNPESASFVNALLDHLHQRHLGISADLSQLSNQIEQLKKTEQLTEDLLQEKLAENPPPKILYKLDCVEDA